MYMYVKFCSDPEDFSGRASVIILIAQRGPKLLKKFEFFRGPGVTPPSHVIDSMMMII